jgi:mevalonate kinase
MLCGEYAVMEGLECLALPVNAGQWLKVWELPHTGNGKIVWQSKEPDGAVWFEARIDSDIMHVAETTDEETSKVLLHLLREVSQRNPDFFHHKTYRVETECEFPRHWGLGTSSTLVQLLAQWCGTDAFALQKAVFGGSGYDVAVAQLGKPLVYWLENGSPNWSPWHLDTTLTTDWWLVFPGNKQNSRKSLASVADKLKEMAAEPMLRGQLDMILRSLHEPKNKMMLEAGLEMWQALLSNILGLSRAYDDLNISPVKGGLCKWLGAWGGDMLLVNNTMLEKEAETFKNMEQLAWNEFAICS